MLRIQCGYDGLDIDKNGRDKKRADVGVYFHLNPAEPVSSKPAQQTVIYIEWRIPDVVLIQ